MKIYQRDKLNVLSAGTYHFIKFNVFFQGGIVPLIQFGVYVDKMKLAHDVY